MNNTIFKAKKVIGTYEGFTATIDVEIRERRGLRSWENLFPVEQGLELAICGSTYRMGGQCLDSFAEEIKDPAYLRIVEIWEEYHLNDLKAGTRKQTEVLDAFKANGWKYDYDQAVAMLKIANVYDDRGYKYGHGWLFQEIPSAIITEIKDYFGG